MSWRKKKFSGQVFIHNLLKNFNISIKYNFFKLKDSFMQFFKISVEFHTRTLRLSIFFVHKN